MHNKTGALDYLSQDPRKLISRIKWDKKNVNFLLDSYLKRLPLIKAELKGKQLGSINCDDWLRQLAEDIRLRCERCVHYPDCQYQCLPSYKAFLDGCCQTCSVSAKPACRRRAQGLLEASVKTRSWTGGGARPYQFYQASISFRKDDGLMHPSHLPNIVFILRGVHDKISDDPDDPFPKLRDSMIDFTRPWGGYPNADLISDRFIHEAALTIIAFNFVFFSDLARKTLFLASRDSTGKEPDPYGSIDDEEMDDSPPGLNGPSFGKKNIVLDTTDVIDLAQKITAIYQSELLPNIDLKYVDPKHKRILTKYRNLSILRADNVYVTHNSTGFHDRLLPEYLQYMLFHNLLVLVQATRMTRFRSRTASIFQGDDLMRLYNKVRELRAERKAEERRNARRKRKRKTISELPPLTLSEACRALDLKYKRTFAALDKHRHRHPKHAEFEKAFLKHGNIKRRHGLIVRYLSESKVGDIDKWKQAVTLWT